MSSSRRDFLAASTIAASALAANRASTAHPPLDAFQIARTHTIIRDQPTPNFFEGMLLGNGDIGLCITVRPDALGLHLGKSDSWDIRVSDEHDSQVLPFAELLKLWDLASEEAKRQGHPEMTYLEEKIPLLRDYTQTVAASYRQIWPRPWPCGIVWIQWDPNRYRVASQSLDPSHGHFHLRLQTGASSLDIRAFVNSTTGHVCAWSDQPAELRSVTYQPYTDPAAQLPTPEVTCTAAALSAFQRFPARLDSKPSGDDRSFALHAILQGSWKHLEPVTFQPTQPQPLRLDVTLFTPRDHPENIQFAAAEAQRLSTQTPLALQESSDKYWIDFWSKSAVQLDDQELERWWYHNQYWLACCLRPGKVAPGVFGNWTSRQIGTAWHGDYHMNYNTQQVFWGVFSSNHADQHFPYIDLVENLLPMSQKYAREKFDLPGAYFPHSAYPVPSQVVPYPVPPWGYEICETPWAVQSLWWHYLYTQDESILRRVYPLLKAAAQFIAAYVKTGEDGKYHVKPTVSPENWGCTVDYRLNQDCIIDLALIDFLLEATVSASEILETDTSERPSWSKIRANLAAYPIAGGPQGDVWLDVPNAPLGWIYNVPVTLAPVFPGERIGLGSKANDLSIARLTAQTVQLEGGNDIVFQPLVRARLGMLDLDWFKREVRYCLLPNGIVNDRARQTGGRYNDSTDFDFMLRMGVWTENLSLPAVLNECFLQSYSGALRLFPNTHNLGPAQFHHFRAAGAFLVSAVWDGHTVSSVTLVSERGQTARLISPWPSTKTSVTSADGHPITVRYTAGTIEFDTRAGVEYRVAPL